MCKYTQEKKFKDNMLCKKNLHTENLGCIFYNSHLSMYFISPLASVQVEIAVLSSSSIYPLHFFSLIYKVCSCHFTSEKVFNNPPCFVTWMTCNFLDGWYFDTLSYDWITGPQRQQLVSAVFMNI